MKLYAAFSTLLWRRRSNGIRVSPRTGLAIIAGNVARDRRDWQAAAAGYRRALDRDPGLAHIWIQYGHALKEADDKTAALDAYRQAFQLDPRARDAALHVGHLARNDGQLAEAAKAYLAAAILDPSRAEATFEFMRVRTRPGDAEVDTGQDGQVAALIAALQNQSGDRDRRVDVPPVGSVSGECAYDVTDLFAFLSRSRVPTGIQRVQLEVLRDILHRNDGQPRRLLCFSPGQAGWVTVPAGPFRALLDASHASADNGDATWQKELGYCLLTMLDQDLHIFASSTSLVNLGTSWMEPAYLAAVRMSQTRSGLRFFALVFDVIPVLYPELFVDTLAREFQDGMRRLFQVADGYIAISQTTARDLRHFADQCGTPMDPSSIAVVPLDVNFRAMVRTVPGRSLVDLGLADHPYVLMVSTLEPRKNHIGAFAAWRLLAQSIGMKQLPLLLCVGGKGWLNSDLHAMLSATPALRRKVRLLSGISDAELALLYTNCLFTLYPSFYEGWGLPVTESLCYGKVPAISNTASMPEAGGPFAAYFDPHDPVDMAARLTPLIVDSDQRHAFESRIAMDFRPRLWSAVANQIETTTRPGHAVLSPNQEILETDQP